MHRTTIACVLTVGFVSILHGVDRLTRDDSCSKLNLDSLDGISEALALLREEMSQLSQMHGMSPYPLSCKEIPEEIAVRRLRMDELEEKINILSAELHRDIFFVWQRALEYPIGTNCSIHMDYPESHKCRPLRAQHLSELRDVDSRTQRLQKMEWHYIEQMFAQNQLKRTYEFKQCARKAMNDQPRRLRSGQGRR